MRGRGGPVGVSDGLEHHGGQALGAHHDLALPACTCAGGQDPCHFRGHLLLVPAVGQGWPDMGEEDLDRFSGRAWSVQQGVQEGVFDS